MNRKQRRAQGQPSKADHARIADQIEASGCGCCGMRFGAGLPYLVARTRTGWVGRCMQPDCNADFVAGSPTFIGTGIFNNDPWTEDDRAWFRANPHRSWRLRWPIPGEVETLATDEELAERAQAYQKVADQARGALRRREQGAAIAIAVYQFEPGKRLRTPFELISGDPPESYTDAAIPALMPILVEIAENHRVYWQADAAVEAEAEARNRRRFEAMAALVKHPAA
jgi:hypothetical protein